MVFAVQETAGGAEYACKVVSKTTLVKARAQSKMLTEINIHRAVSCGHVVRFVRCFEDEANVYILMELCSNRTLADVVKKRGAMREEEAACYLREVLAATAHLHAMRVIHRDLKLGNLFLTAEGLAEVEKDGPGTDPSLGRDAQSCRIKIGDFGLACSLENDSQRRKTVCGTPNYIAPEVLMGKQGVGHSYEVDTWSMGVILYTLVYGTPPFQTKDVKLTYKRIRANEYEFPAEPAVSESTKQLIRAALSADPARRPSLLEMSRHELLQKGAEGWALSDEKPKPYVERRRESFMSPSSKKSRPSRTEENTTSRFASPSATSLRSPLQSLDQNNMHRQSTSGWFAPEPTPRLLDASQMDAVDEDSFSRRRSSQHLTGEDDYDPEMGQRSLRKKLDDMQLNLDDADSSAAMKKAFPPLWVAKWVDYSSKYGVGYMLSDGTVGIYFNDATKMVYTGKSDNSIILYRGSEASPLNRNVEPVAVDPKNFDKTNKDIVKKVKLAAHFHHYITTGSGNPTVFKSHGGLDSVETPSWKRRELEPIGSRFVKSCLKSSKGIFWRLSNRTVQFNFFDESEMFLSPTHQLIVFNDASAGGKQTVCSLDDIPRDNEGLLRALRHVKDVLHRVQAGKA